MDDLLVILDMFTVVDYIQQKDAASQPRLQSDLYACPT